MHLEARYAGNGSVGSPDFCREVRESGKFVSVDGRHVRKEGAGQLHAVTGISCETYDYIFDVNYFVFHLFIL